MDHVFGPFDKPYGANDTASDEDKKTKDPSRAIGITIIVVLVIFGTALVGAAYVTYRAQVKKRKLRETEASTQPENTSGMA
ncbi:hypothetical protein ACHAPT_002162 [Fusarium lateritium]